jgi:HlyD family secretion protein
MTVPLQNLRQSALRLIKRRPLLSAGIGAGVLLLGAALVHTSSKPAQAYSFYDVRRGDFLVSVVEGGALEAVNEVVIRNEVEGTARIIYIVPEGSNVQKDDLLVELDSSQAQDQVNLQEINVEKAQFSVKQADATLQIQKSIEDSNLQAASNRLEFAQTDLSKYIKGEAQQARRNAQIEITNVVETLVLAEDSYRWSDQLFTNGFETKSRLDQDRLKVDQTLLRLEQATNALWMVETFDIPKRQRELEAARDEARENLERAMLQADRRLSQAKADLETQKKTLDLSLTKLERDRKQLEAAKIYAPQDGLVVYATPSGGGRGFSSESMIEEGAVVRNRQELIKLPDVSAMKLTVKIHESHINQVRLGQPAYVVLDSMPDQRFKGHVNKVAPLPDTQSRFANPDLKVYATEVLVTDQLPDLKPGVSARAEIVITNLPGVLTVPMQAVTTRKGKQVVFLASAPLQPVPVSVGLYNSKFIEVTSGLREGDQVLLSPPFDTKEKDLGGSIIVEGEAVPSATNLPVGALSRAASGNGNHRSSPRADAGDPGDAPGALAVADKAGDNGATAAAESALRGKRNGRRNGAAGEAPGDGRAAAQAMLKRFDADGDSKLSDAELNALWVGQRVSASAADSGSDQPVPPPELKQFDTNADGKLDEAELAALLETVAHPRGNGPSRSGATN